MKITLDDWLVIIERDNHKRIFNTEMWIEWGNVGVITTTIEERMDAEWKVITRAIQTFRIEKE